jgi:hypothetical protein
MLQVICFMYSEWLRHVADTVQLSSQHRDIFEHLLSAYAEIGAALPRFDRYEKVFKENLDFRNVLATVYSGILEFHQRAYKFFQRRGMLTFMNLSQEFGSYG